MIHYDPTWIDEWDKESRITSHQGFSFQYNGFNVVVSPKLQDIRPTRITWGFSVWSISIYQPAQCLKQSRAHYKSSDAATKAAKVWIKANQ